MIRRHRNRALLNIGMPVYNEGCFIRRSLDGLLCQSVKDFELIISDNASTDGTADICREYAARDPRIRYYRLEANIGGMANFNRVFQLSNAEYFFWASGHDLRDTDFTSKCLEIMENDKSVVLCYPIAKWIEYDGTFGEEIHSHIETRGLDRFSKFNSVLWGIQYAYPIYGVLRSSALEKTGLFGNTLGADIILLSELSFFGAYSELSEPLLYIRKLNDNGNWSQYYAKAFGSKYMPSSFYLFSRMLNQFVKIVNKHVYSFPQKIAYFAGIMFCMLTKYRSYLLKIR